jgi:hypothetical protein
MEAILSNPIPFRTKPPLRTVTQDGTIWNVNRAALKDSGLARERMAHDISAIYRQRGANAVITTDDLLSLGWTRGQVERHWRDASAMVKRDEAASYPVSA